MRDVWTDNDKKNKQLWTSDDTGKNKKIKWKLEKSLLDLSVTAFE